MSIEDQIEFIDEMLAHTGNPEELEALRAIRESLVGLDPSDPSALKGTSPKKGRNGSRTKPKIKLQHYQEFVGVYNDFCLSAVGVPAEFDEKGIQGRALKETVVYIMKQEKVNGDEILALDAWRYIFSNWSLLTEFIQRQTKLSDIKKNIQEILFQLRNASKEAKRRKSDKDWDQYRKLRQGK